MADNINNTTVTVSTDVHCTGAKHTFTVIRLVCGTTGSKRIRLKIPWLAAIRSDFRPISAPGWDYPVLIACSLDQEAVQGCLSGEGRNFPGAITCVDEMPEMNSHM